MTAVLTAGVLTSGAAAASGALKGGSGVLVYAGNDALDQGYQRLGQAAGQAVTTTTQLPSGLARYRCIVLPLNQLRFSDAQTRALADYLKHRGTIIAEGDGSVFSQANQTLNDLASDLGADISLRNADLDPGFHTTALIDRHRTTRGVSSIMYAYTSAVSVRVQGNARSLVRVQGGETLIAMDRVHGGNVILSGDTNVFSDNSGSGYADHDNGVLAANLCGQRK